MRIAAVSLIFSLILSTSLTFTGQSSPPYSENVQVLFLSNSSQVFRLDIKGMNQTAKEILALESKFTGVQGYTVSVTSRPPKDETDILAFLDLYTSYPIMEDGSRGSISPGVKIIVKGDESSAKGFITELGLRFQINFVKVGEGTFFGQANFVDLVGEKLWVTLPSEGFSRFISKEEFLNTDFARFTLVFDRASNSREVVLTGLKRTQIGPGTYRFSTTFPSLERQSVNASRATSSSKVSLLFVGSLIETSQTARFSNNLENLTASAEISFQPGQKVPNFNITITKPPPRLIAQRTIDRGSIGFGKDVEVMLTIRNIAPLDSIPARNVTIRENWWNQDFKFVAGDKTEQVVEELKGKNEIKIVYRLTAISNQSKFLTQSPDQNTLRYSFKLGNTTHMAIAATNSSPILLNIDGPVVSITVNPVLEEAVQAWGPIKLIAHITNYGNRSAFDLTVGDLKRSSLTSRDTWNAEAEIAPSTIGQTKINKVLALRWFDGRETRETIGNSIELGIAYVTTKLPKARITSTSSWKMVNGSARVTLEYTLDIQEPGGISGYEVALKPERNVKVIEGRNFTLTNGVYIVKGERLAKSQNKFSVVFDLPGIDNLVVPPAKLTLRSGGITVNRFSNPSGVPAAVTVFREIAPKENFPRFNITFSVRVRNNGTQPVFGVKLTAGDKQVQPARGIDTLSLSNLTSSNSPASLTFSGFLRTAGQYNISAVKLEFQFVGNKFSIESEQAIIRIYEPVKVSLSGPSTVRENEAFKLQISLENRSPLEVSQVTIDLADLPPLVQLLEGSRVIAVSSLGPNEKKQVEITLRAVAPATLQIPSPKVTFSYSGALVPGESEAFNITVREETLFRYGIPVLIAVALLSFTAYVTKSEPVTARAAPR